MMNNSNLMEASPRWKREGIDLPGFEERLRSHLGKPLTFIHMSNWGPGSKVKVKRDERDPRYRPLLYQDANKLGLNPTSEDNTPIGVYGYPHDKKHFEEIVAGTWTLYRGSAKYAHVFRIKPEYKARVLDLAKISKANYESLVIKAKNAAFELGEEYEYSLEDFIELRAQAEKDAKVQTWAGKLWNLTRFLAKTRPPAWSKLLLKMGYVAVYDSGGKGIIHDNEPAQVVVFSVKAIDHVDAIPNPGRTENKIKEFPKLKTTEERQEFLRGIRNNHEIAELLRYVNTDEIAIELIPTFLDSSGSRDITFINHVLKRKLWKTVDAMLQRTGSYMTSFSSNYWSKYLTEKLPDGHLLHGLDVAKSDSGKAMILVEMYLRIRAKNFGPLDMRELQGVLRQQSTGVRGVFISRVRGNARFEREGKALHKSMPRAFRALTLKIQFMIDKEEEVVRLEKHFGVKRDASDAEILKAVNRDLDHAGIVSRQTTFEDLKERFQKLVELRIEEDLITDDNINAVYAEWDKFKAKYGSKREASVLTASLRQYKIETDHGFILLSSLDQYKANPLDGRGVPLPIGEALAMDAKRKAAMGRYLFVEDVQVAPALRGLGAGVQLYLKAFEYATRNGYAGLASSPSHTRPQDADRVWASLRGKGAKVRTLHFGTGTRHVNIKVLESLPDGFSHSLRADDTLGEVRLYLHELRGWYDKIPEAPAKLRGSNWDGRVPPELEELEKELVTLSRKTRSQEPVVEEAQQKTAARPIPLDKRDAKHAFTEIVEHLREAARQLGDKPIKQMRRFSGIAHVVDSKNGQVRAVRTGFAWSKGLPADEPTSGAQHVVGLHRIPSILFNLNEDAPASRFTDREVLKGMWHTFIHELTHAADYGILKHKTDYEDAKYETDSSGNTTVNSTIDLKKYYNDPYEVRAYMRELHEKLDAQVKGALRKDPNADLRNLIQQGLKDEPRWHEMSKYMTPKNRKRVLKGILTEFTDEDLIHPKEEKMNLLLPLLQAVPDDALESESKFTYYIRDLPRPELDALQAQLNKINDYLKRKGKKPIRGIGAVAEYIREGKKRWKKTATLREAKIEHPPRDLKLFLQKYVKALSETFTGVQGALRALKDIGPLMEDQRDLWQFVHNDLRLPSSADKLIENPDEIPQFDEEHRLPIGYALEYAKRLLNLYDSDTPEDKKQANQYFQLLVSDIRYILKRKTEEYGETVLFAQLQEGTTELLAALKKAIAEYEEDDYYKSDYYKGRTPRDIWLDFRGIDKEKYERMVSLLKRISVLVPKVFQILEAADKQLSARLNWGDANVPASEDTETLYHATVDGKNLFKNGFDPKGPPGERGIGGGQEKVNGVKTISFTSDLYIAKEIAKSLKEVIGIANGEIKLRHVLEWLDGTEYKDAVLKGAQGSWGPMKDEPKWVYELYRWYLSYAEGAKKHRRYNPLYFGVGIETFKGLDHKNVGVLVCTVNMRAEGIKYLAAMHEYRVPPTAVLSVDKLLAESGVLQKTASAQDWFKPLTDMTLEEFTHPPKIVPASGYHLLYHAVTRPPIEERLRKIAVEGLRLKAVNEYNPTPGNDTGGALWATTEADGYSFNAPIVIFQVPENDPAIDYVTGGGKQAIIMRDIEPKDILWIDLVAPVSGQSGLMMRNNKYAEQWYEFLQENKPKTALTRFEKETGKKPVSPNIEKLKALIGNPRAFFHMSDIGPKSGSKHSDMTRFSINPRSKWDTPLGLYAYPMTQEYVDKLMRKGGYYKGDQLPLKEDAQFTYVFTVRDGQRLLDLDNYSTEDYKRDYMAIKETYLPILGEQGITQAINTGIGSAKDVKNRYASRLWNITRTLALRLVQAKKTKSPKSMVVWAGILAKLGYVGATDQGMGLIHENEPKQAVFFAQAVVPIESKGVLSLEFVETTGKLRWDHYKDTPGADKTEHHYDTKHLIRLLRDSDPEVRRLMILNLGGDQYKYLRLLVNDKDNKIRTLVSRMLPAKYLPLMMEEPDEWIRVIVAHRIDEKHLPKMLELSKSGEHAAARAEIARRIDQKYLPKMLSEETDRHVIEHINARLRKETTA